jgi:ATP-dependent Clp protease adaptor protein ClpS
MAWSPYSPFVPMCRSSANSLLSEGHDRRYNLVVSEEAAKSPSAEGGGTATAKPKKRAVPKPKPPKMLPPWKVLLHNDDKNDISFVVVTIMELTPLNQDEAVQRTFEAHQEKVALLLVTHKERAELYQEQFQSKGLTVSIEEAEE